MTLPHQIRCYNIHFHSTNSKDDGTRTDANKAILAICKGTSNYDANEGLMKQLFAVLGGSEGKITLAAHKISILTSIGDMTEANLQSSGFGKLTVVTTELMVKFIETEAHEGRIIILLRLTIL